MKAASEIEWKPYVDYRNNFARIEEFLELTRLSYGLSLQLLSKYPKEMLSDTKIHPPDDAKEYSFAQGDLQFNAELVSCLINKLNK